MMEPHHHLPHRDMQLIIGAVLLAVVGLPILLLARAGMSPSSSIVISDVHPAAVIVPFTTLRQGTQSVVSMRVNYVLTSPAELSELWKTIDAPGAPPRVDFRTHIVLAVFAGKESSTSISVARIEDSDARLVSVTIATPTGACAQAQMSASPYEIVAVPATSLPLKHEDVPTPVSCPK